MHKRFLKECPNITQVLENRYSEIMNALTQNETSALITEEEEIEIAKFLEKLPTKSFVRVIMFGYLSDTSKDVI